MSELIVPVLTALAIMTLPGVTMGLAVGARGVWLAAAAAPLSLTAVATASILGEWVGLTWSVVPVVLVTVVAAVVLAVGRRVLAGRWGADDQRPVPEKRALPSWLEIAAAVGLAALLIGRRLGLILQEPGAVSQTYDNVFHLNAVGYIEHTGSASPFTLGLMTSDGSLGFYPSAWHAVVSLVAQLGDGSVAVASNAVMIAVACLVWPLSVVFLARVWFGRSPWITIAAGVFSASAAAFPLLPVYYGVLYPLFLSGAILPVALAALSVVLGQATDQPPRAWAGVLLLGFVPGLAVAHPSALVALLAFSVPIVTWQAVQIARAAASARRRAVIGVAYVAYLAAGLQAIRVLRPPSEAAGWQPTQTVAQAVGEILTGGMYGMPVAWALAGFTLVGAAALVRRGHPAAAAASGAYVVAGFLFIVASAMTWMGLRMLLTGPWYNNTPRLAALVPVAAVPLAAYGVEVVRQWAVAEVRRRDVSWRWSPVLTGTIAVAMLVASTFVGAPLRAITAEAQHSYRMTDDSTLLAPDEVALLERLSDEVPDDAVIAGNPFTGAGMTWAYADRKPLMAHLLMEIDRDTTRINEELREAVPGSAVCGALDRKGVDYVLDFGRVTVYDLDPSGFEGLERLDRSAAVREIDRQGDAVLYEVVGC